MGRADLFRVVPAWFFFFNDTATTEIYTLSLHDALPISGVRLELLQTGDRRRHRHRAGPERAREEDPHRRLAQRLAAEAGGDRVAVAERLRVAGEVGLHADVLA